MAEQQDVRHSEKNYFLWFLWMFLNFLDTRLNCLCITGYTHMMFNATWFPVFVGAVKKKQINEQEENKTHRKQWWERGHREPLLWRTAWVHTDPWLWCSRGQPVMEVLQNMYVICRQARSHLPRAGINSRLPACYTNWTTLADSSAYISKWTML